MDNCYTDENADKGKRHMGFVIPWKHGNELLSSIFVNLGDSSATTTCDYFHVS